MIDEVSGDRSFDLEFRETFVERLEAGLIASIEEARCDDMLFDSKLDFGTLPVGRPPHYRSDMAFRDADASSVPWCAGLVDDPRVLDEDI